MKIVEGIEIPETTAEALKTYLDNDLKDRLVNPNPHSEFSSPGTAISALKRCGFVVEWVDTTTRKVATWSSEAGTCKLMMKANGLAFVKWAGDDVPRYTLTDQAWSLAPRFRDAEGVVTWIFNSFGDRVIDAVLGFSLLSSAPEPAGWQQGRFAKYIPLPEVWLREPAHVRSLRSIPLVLREELMRLREAEAS